MLVDPRPYTYEFRKPRYSNPTLYVTFNTANLAIYTKVFTTAKTMPKMTISLGTVLHFFLTSNQPLKFQP